MVIDAAERIRVAVEDLEFLKTSWTEDVEDASLRRSSPILRRLLVDGDLQRAWHDLGLDNQPIIRAPSLQAQLRRIPLRQVAYAQAGGATYQGLTVMTPIEMQGYLPPEKAREIFGSPGDLPERDLALGKFMKSPCVVANGIEISRHTLVKYVANKLGGTHLDPRRDLAKEEERKFHLLDAVRAQYITAGKPAVYFEVLSLGQALLRSSDIHRFLGAGAHAVPRTSMNL